jgi:hypothetical protein
VESAPRGLFVPWDSWPGIFSKETISVFKTNKGDYTRISFEDLCRLVYGERIDKPLPNVITYKLLEACREPGCPVCRVEQDSVERYLDNQFYENVNSPRWRDRLRASLGFCHEHAWLAVDKRLGDALGFTIIYHDVVNNIVRQLDKNSSAPNLSVRRSFLRQLPDQARDLIKKALEVISPRKRCPACEHRDEAIRTILSTLLEELTKSEMTDALHASDGLCLPHLRLALEHVRDVAVLEKLLTIQREKLENLRDELAEFIRKSDYQLIDQGFGAEGNAWLRAVNTIAGRSRLK